MNKQQQMQALNTAVRVLEIARMLPAAGTISEDQTREIIACYGQYTFKNEVSDAAVAKSIGVPASMLSQWKSQTYKGASERIDEITRLVNNWMEADARRRHAGLDVPFISTWVAEGMTTLAKVAHEEGCMCALVVPAGAGKTVVLKRLARDLAGIYLYCDDDHTPRQFMLALAAVCGVTISGDKGNTIASVKAAIIDKLKGTGRMILLDEAHRLPPQCFSRIRSIHDESGCAIVMAGTHEIIDRIDDRSGSRGQMASRCIQWIATEHVTNAASPEGNRAGRSLFTVQEIEAFISHLRIKLTSDALAFLWAVACLPEHGCLRLARRVVRIVQRIRAGDESPIQRTELESTLKMLFGAQGDSIIHNANTHTRLTAAA